MSTHHETKTDSANPTPDYAAEKLTTPLSRIVDIVLSIAFFVFMYSIVRSHVQSSNPLYIKIWAGGASACMTGVFWLAVQMFRVVLRAQVAAKRAPNQ